MSAPVEGGEHTCPGGCQRTVHSAHFACRQCWRRLPIGLQTPILTGFWADDWPAHSRACVDAMHWFHDHPLSAVVP